MDSFDLVIKGGLCVLPSGIQQTDLGIRFQSGRGTITKIGDISNAQGAKILDAKGLHVLPGVIDTQVHFREPGLEHKENMETGSRSAVLGGVTGFLEMPNTKPPTASPEAIADKLARAEDHSWCNYGFFVGATAENAAHLHELEKLPGVPGIKIFMGSSTGDLLVDQEATLHTILSKGAKRIAIHAEDEQRLVERKRLIPKNATASFHPEWRDEEVAFLATQKIVSIARKYNRRLHLLHISSKKEIQFLKDHKDLVTVECLPQFLMFHAPDIYEKIGPLAQMNPPIRSAEHQAALWKGLQDGTIDIIGTDHAPHTREEKSKPYPETPSGMPGVQTLVPVMLNFVNEGRLSLEHLCNLISKNPAKTYGIKRNGEISLGFDANLTIVDLKRTEEVKESWLASKCGWSPYTGLKLKGWPVGTIVNGQTVMWQGQIFNKPNTQRFEFA